MQQETVVLANSQVFFKKKKQQQSEAFLLFLWDLNLKRNMWHTANSKLA